MKIKDSSTSYLGLIFVSILTLIFIINTFGFSFITGHSSYWQSETSELTQHLSGINMYLSSPWQFPLLAFDSLNYPAGTRVTFIDGIPALAFLLKIFIPKNTGWVNPLGYWVALCFFLQSFSAWWISKELQVKSWAFLIFLTMAFLTFPALMMRLIHVALMSHWIILFSIALYLRGQRLTRLPIYLWTLLITLSYYIHIYLWLMALGIYVASALELRKKNKSIDKKQLFLPVGVWFVSLFIFLLPIPMTYVNKGGGFGLFSMNLLAPILGGKLMAVQAKLMPGQGEGFNYLGLGVIFAFLYIVLAKFTETKNMIKRHQALFILLLVCALYSLSDHIYFGQKLMVILNYPGFLAFVFEQFRSSGRFFWPVGYIIIIFSGYMLYRYSTKRTFPVLVGIFLFIQLIDISDYYLHLRAQRDKSYVAVINYPTYDKILGKEAKYIYFYPKYNCSHATSYDHLLPLMKYAATRHLILNTGYIAKYRPACDDVMSEIAHSSHRISAYIFLKSDYSNKTTIANVMGDKQNIVCTDIDFAYLCHFKS